MSNFTFVQVNSRDIQSTIDQLTDKKAVGFEVVNPTIISWLEINIDPQHTGVMHYGENLGVENKSAALYVLGKLPTIDPEHQEVILIEKADIDSIAACALWLHAIEISAMENNHEEHDDFLALCERVKSIDAMDCGLGNQGTEWDPDYYKTQLKEGASAFNVLGAMVSDFKTPLAIRVELMRRWLVEGYLPQHYLEQQRQEFEKVHNAKISTLHGVVCVQTQARNVSSIIYSQVPCGVAYNDNFPTPNGAINKFTIMAFNGRDYIDFDSLLFELNQEEPGWGGNLKAGIIGSPFTGTDLDPNVVCSIVAKHVK